MNGYRSKHPQHIGSTRGRPAFYRMECDRCGHVWNFQETETEVCDQCGHENESVRYRWYSQVEDTYNE